MAPFCIKHHTRNNSIRTIKIPRLEKKGGKIFRICQRERTTSVTNTESNFFSLQIFKATMHSQR